MRRDPTVRGTFPLESKSEKVSLAGWEKSGGRDARALLFLLVFPNRGAHTPRLPVSAHGLAMTVGRTAYAPAMRIAGRDYGTSQGTKPAPARVMASANGQSNHDRIM